ncbi:hypothetical protein V8E53_001812 [Lactarius tabidus]
MSAHLRSSISPPATVSIQHNEHPLTPPDSLNIPWPASNVVLDNMLPTDSHLLIIHNPSPRASPGSNSSPNLGAAAEDDGMPKLGLHGEMVPLELLSVNRPIDASTMATPDLPLHSTSLPSVINSDVAIASHSLRESNAERTEHLPPDPSRCQYDIV